MRTTNACVTMPATLKSRYWFNACMDRASSEFSHAARGRLMNADGKVATWRQELGSVGAAVGASAAPGPAPVGAPAERAQAVGGKPAGGVAAERTVGGLTPRAAAAGSPRPEDGASGASAVGAAHRVEAAGKGLLAHAPRTGSRWPCEGRREARCELAGLQDVGKRSVECIMKAAAGNER